ncbi:MAG: acyl-CoA dehydrogenase family protein [Erythrobacter sp.]|jgi:alkylation response protein AidB-like acyl-CoA dehydrogenase|uniref:acyl-CoA dehydrogenase family protein n=1 Tax=Qipengyuania citrea TaxID=225971 RepID=UPI0020A1527B|nr:acyl-CoA dehydrogenase family protein [Qipengyuania citrea]MCP2018733.1 alkylation response protein AidB-like acyl-CoA dehydrogenase [Qipengyuania citrea]MDE0902534.1 acyl-CoA dehydrogenase family protein [Erythrobacter sp.]
MQTFVTEAVDWPETAPALREQVRALVAAYGERDPVRRANSWTKANPQFSKKLGEAGLLGMTWPKEYGGHERSQLERYVVIEELLAAGAPVGAHWIADRQSGPLLLRLGNEELKRRWVPAIARGEAFACIGLSEPNSGSDLASVRTAARRDGDGWVLNGQKVWTTGAHVSHFIIALVRSEAGSERQQGLSQFVIPMDTPGVSVKPIIDLTGAHEFNEVFFEDVRLPETALLGTEGEGWKQATAELSLERAGPERYLSSMVLFLELVRYAGAKQDMALQQLIGRLTADAWTLRLMSASVATKLARGEDPALEATMVKDLGNSYEQAIPQLVQAAADLGDTDAATLRDVCFYLLQVSPSFSLRGGTREIIKGIIARGLGLR